MSRIAIAGTICIAVVTLSDAPARAHCQVPCGIFGDHARVEMMREDLTTITKAMRQIRALSKKKDARSRNQLVRWVVAKEQHAEKIIRTISDYFLAQKIKAPKTVKGQPHYLQQLTRHHAVMVAAMKCKQDVNDKAARALGQAIDGIAGFWPKKK